MIKLSYIHALGVTLDRMQNFIVTFIITFILISCRQEKKKDGKISNIDISKIDTVYTLKEPPNALKWIRHENFNNINLPSSVTIYIEKKYQPLDTAMGDFDFDNISDLLLVTCFEKEDSLRFDPKTLKRQLFLFAGQIDNSYKLVAKNWNAIPCINCCGMGDPFGGISISKGEVSIIEYCASNCKSIDKYIFKYDKSKNNLFLDNQISESFCFDYQDYYRDTTNFIGNKKVSITAFDILKEDE